MERTSSAIHAVTNPIQLQTLRVIDKKIALAKSKDSGSKSSKPLTLEGRTVSDICQKNPDVPAVWIGKLAELLAIENPTTNPNALPLDLVASRKRSSRQCGCHYCQVMWLSKEDGAKCKVAPPNRYTYHNLETGENFHTQIYHGQPAGHQMHSQRVPQNAFDIVLTALQSLIGQKQGATDRGFRGLT